MSDSTLGVLTAPTTGLRELFAVRHEPNFLITLDDGTELAASGYFPVSGGPWPTLLTCYPYHKDEVFGWALEPANRYFASHGYASIVLDMRGTGGSGGRRRETMHGEGEDCAGAVEWLAAQPWCDGNVGMWGISYGGITALSAAAAQPPHLKAIAPIFGALDRYFDSFAPGGCPKLHFPNMWGTAQLAHHLSPPMHQDPDGRWYRIWQERLADPEDPLPRRWQDHLAYDSFWDDNRTDPDLIRVPTFVIAGWRDMFPDVAVRAFESIRAPRKLLMGPWLHEMPAYSPMVPVDHFGEMRRWFDQWLRGDDTGIQDEPKAQVYVMGTGVWTEEADWPPASAQELTLFLGGQGALLDGPPEIEESLPYKTDPTVGFTSGHEFPGGLPLDQGPDDLKSLTFTTQPLTRPVVIAGRAEATLQLAIEDASDANLVVKLCDVGPDGASKLIAMGWLKASHRASHERPEPLEPGRVYEFRVPFWATAYEIAEGHSLRLAFSCADFPRIWPTDENPTVRLHLGGAGASSLKVPTATVNRAKVGPPAPDPAIPAPLALEGDGDWAVSRKILCNEVSVGRTSRAVIRSLGGDRIETQGRSTSVVEASRPQGARCESFSLVRMALPSGGEVVIEAHSHVTRHGATISGRVQRDGQVIFEKQWVK